MDVQPGEPNVSSVEPCFVCAFVGGTATATFKCIQDGVLLCKQHADAHITSHSTHTLTEDLPARCLEHDKELAFFCAQDSKLLCKECWELTHFDHEVSTTMLGFEKAEPHMENLLNQGKSVLLSVEQMTKELRQCSHDLSAKSLTCLKQSVLL